jgi:hypothetical protein
MPIQVRFFGRLKKQSYFTSRQSAQDLNIPGLPAVSHVKCRKLLLWWFLSLVACGILAV